MVTFWLVSEAFFVCVGTAFMIIGPLMMRDGELPSGIGVTITGALIVAVNTVAALANLGLL
jgi:hypothetical protein